MKNLPGSGLKMGSSPVGGLPSESTTLDNIVYVLKMKREKKEDDNDFEGGINVAFMTKVSQHTLKSFLENEPDIYTDADLKVKYK